MPTPAELTSVIRGVAPAPRWLPLSSPRQRPTASHLGLSGIDGDPCHPMRPWRRPVRTKAVKPDTTSPTRSAGESHRREPSGSSGSIVAAVQLQRLPRGGMRRGSNDLRRRIAVHQHRLLRRVREKHHLHFGLQVDGVTFQEGIVLEVQPGTSPVPAGGAVGQQSGSKIVHAACGDRAHARPA
jgi:hypothetical protein